MNQAYENRFDGSGDYLSIDGSIAGAGSVETLVKIKDSQGRVLVLGDVLASGAFGDVYSATYKADGEACAVKVSNVTQEGLEEVDYLKRLCGGLTRVVKCHDSFELDGKLYVVMDLCEETLQTRVRDCIWPSDEIARVTRELALALLDVHSRGVLHLDVKLDNILLNGRKVFLADFNCSQLFDNCHPASLAFPAIASPLIPCGGGTPGYISPEHQLLLPVTAAADTYSLGCVVCVMLTGRKPLRVVRDWWTVDDLTEAVAAGKLSLERTVHNFSALTPAQQQLLRGMLQPLAAQRMSLLEVLQNLFVCNGAAAVAWVAPPVAAVGGGPHEEGEVVLPKSVTFPGGQVAEVQEGLGAAGAGPVYAASVLHADVRGIHRYVLSVGDSTCPYDANARVMSHWCQGVPGVVQEVAWVAPVGSTRVYTLMERCDGGRVSDLIQRKNEEKVMLPESAAGSIFIQMARTLDGMHDRGAFHLGLTTHCMLLLGRNEAVPKVKLSGFRTARRSEGLATEPLRRRRYKSPEQIAGCCSAWWERTDSFSLGVCLYEMLTGELPFPEPPEAPAVHSAEASERFLTELLSGAAFQLRCDDEKFLAVSAPAQALLRAMLEGGVEQRLSLAEALASDFVFDVLESVRDVKLAGAVWPALSVSERKQWMPSLLDCVPDIDMNNLIRTPPREVREYGVCGDVAAAVVPWEVERELSGEEERRRNAVDVRRRVDFEFVTEGDVNGVVTARLVVGRDGGHVYQCDVIGAISATTSDVAVGATTAAATTCNGDDAAVGVDSIQARGQANGTAAGEVGEGAGTTVVGAEACVAAADEVWSQHTAVAGAAAADTISSVATPEQCVVQSVVERLVQSVVRSAVQRVVERVVERAVERVDELRERERSVAAPGADSDDDVSGGDVSGDDDGAKDSNCVGCGGGGAGVPLGALQPTPPPVFSTSTVPVDAAAAPASTVEAATGTAAAADAVAPAAAERKKRVRRRRNKRRLMSRWLW